jgi:hypothetical protein
MGLVKGGSTQAAESPLNPVRFNCKFRPAAVELPSVLFAGVYRCQPRPCRIGIIQLRGGLSVGAGEQVPVYVGRDRDSRVTRPRAHDFERHAPE